MVSATWLWRPLVLDYRSALLVIVYYLSNHQKQRNLATHKVNLTDC